MMTVLNHRVIHLWFPPCFVYADDDPCRSFKLLLRFKNRQLNINTLLSPTAPASDLLPLAFFICSSTYLHPHLHTTANMVHLATVKRDSENVEPLVKRVDSIKLETTDDDDFYSTVYGTRFAAEQLPQTEMPEKEMPREVAYRMIKDELSLDGNPMLK
jgi:hypothetical protein